MDSTVLYAITSLIIGGILLFFGAKFIKLAVGMLGALIGFNIGTALFSHTDINQWLEFTVVLAVAILVGMVAVTFYKFFIRLSVSYTAGSLLYGILHRLDVDVILSLMLGVGVGLFIFFFIKAFNLIETLFAFVTSIQGASSIIAGILLLVEPTTFELIQHGHYAQISAANYVWLLAWAVLFVFGLSFQLRKPPTPQP